MRDYHALFHASPEAFFSSLEAEMRDLAQGIANISRRVDALSQLYHEILKTRLPVLSATRPGWSYDSRDPSPIFDNVFEPEITGAEWKRWVKASGALHARLVLPRQHAYSFEAVVVDFCSEMARESFRLTIDGAPTPWKEINGSLFSAIVPARPETDFLDFALSVDPNTVTKDVSFAFKTITITPVPAEV